MACIFVGGYLRTGTTLLQSILCASPDCNPMIGEAVFLRGLVESYGRALGLFDEHTRYYFDDREDVRRLCAGYVEQFINRTSKRFGDPAHLVLKHPQLTANFPLLHDLLPEAKFIVVLRDPRDAVASAITAQNKGASEFGGAGPKQIAENLSMTYRSCFGCVRQSFHRQVLYVKYEDLVRRPELVVPAIQEFTGIDLSEFSPNLDNLRTEVDFDNDAEQRRPLHSEHYGKTITDARIGRFNDALTDDDATAIEGICKAIYALYQRDLPAFTAVLEDNRIRIRAYLAQ